MSARSSGPRATNTAPCARMRTSIAVLSVLLIGPAARADEVRTLATLQEVHEACRAQRARPASEIFVVELEPDWRFGTLDEEGFLAIEPRRNFRALEGRVELIPARLEAIGVVATPERADELEAARARGARLRVGFFLGLDEPDRTACVLRSRHGITTVRMDVAFVELVAPDGSVLARQDTERLRAWRDDEERAAIPGRGPRAAIGPATTPSGTPPVGWQRAVDEAASAEVGRAVADCHRQGVARGADAHGRVVVRLRVDARTGSVLASEPALSDVGDSDEAGCIAGAFRGLALPPAPADSARVVELSVPVRLAAD